MVLIPAICNTWWDRRRRVLALDRPIYAIRGGNDERTDRSGCTEHDAMRGRTRETLRAGSEAGGRLRRPSGRLDPAIKGNRVRGFNEPLVPMEWGTP